MTELEIVERLRRRFGVAGLGMGRGVVVGIGDDCAVFRPVSSREDLVFTSDQVIEGVHFRSSWPARRTGEKALARALSDIAAMGAEPRFALVSIAFPRRFDFDAFFAGVARVARRYGVTVAGGDLARAKTVSCDVVVCGSVPRGKALLRSTAKVGDAIYVSGPLGLAAARGYRDVPEPRIAMGKKLRGRATACMDLSDGLSIDLHRMCVASGVGAALGTVPVAKGATEEQALHGGEDYELLYTGPAGLPGIRIGDIILSGFPAEVRGWDHFA